jgi:hypothetical protein
MLTDAQVRVSRRKLMEGKTQEAAAAAAGVSVRSARNWQTGPYPSKARRPHDWRTRRVQKKLTGLTAINIVDSPPEASLLARHRVRESTLILPWRTGCRDRQNR